MLFILAGGVARMRVQPGPSALGIFVAAIFEIPHDQAEAVHEIQ